MNLTEPLNGGLPVVEPASAFGGQIGLSQIDITPPVGIYARNWGAARHDVATSIHRPLTFNVMTLQEEAGGPPLILIDADLGFWREFTFMNAILEGVQADHQVGPERIVFSLTHTHAGPRIIDSTADVQGGEQLQIWMHDTIVQARQAVSQALANAKPSLLEWHYGTCQLASNRDLHDPASSTGRRICGYAPGTSADQTLLIGRISESGGQLRGMIVNYACHPTTLAFDNEAISPDFIGAMRETISQATAVNSVFFLQGASGELAPRYQYVAETAVADRHGRQLAYAALATLEDMEPPGTTLHYQGVVESGAPLAIWKPLPVAAPRTLQAVEGTVELALKDLPSSAEIQQQLLVCQDRALAERLNRKLDVRQKLGEGTTFRLPIYGWKIGSALVIGTMAESYSQFQTEIRAAFPGQHVICLNIINGWIGYLAPELLYDEDIYQVWQSPFARGSLEQTIAAAIQLIHQLTSESSH